MSVISLRFSASTIPFHSRLAFLESEVRGQLPALIAQSLLDPCLGPCNLYSH
jgi:hypothetical protein